MPLSAQAVASSPDASKLSPWRCSIQGPPKGQARGAFEDPGECKSAGPAGLGSAQIVLWLSCACLFAPWTHQASGVRGERGQWQSKPRSVGALVDAHEMAVLMQTALAEHCRSAHGIAARALARTVRSPAGTCCPTARGLSTQREWERTPRAAAARSCLPCPLNSAEYLTRQ